MKIQDILKQTKHRPWDLPKGKWAYYQEWNRAVFLHWEVDDALLRKYIPKDLIIDLFEGKAWVSLVAFSMNKIRPRLVPAFSPISDFDEINIRTYVNYNNKSGVYFLSIEGGKALSCIVAKLISELPYRYSKIHRKNKSYNSLNYKYNEKFDLEYDILEKNHNKSDLDLWLTERYALFQENGKSINEFEIHHIDLPFS
jgi:hypothetical protein